MNNTPEELELFTLSALKTIEDVLHASDAGLRDESWQVDSHSAAWDYMLARARDGNMATPKDVEGATSVTLIPDITDGISFLGELVNLTIIRRAKLTFSEHGGDLMVKNPRKSLELMIGDLSEIVKNANGHTKHYDQDIMDYLAKVQQRSEIVARGDLIGIPTGIEWLDSKGDTWSPGELAAIQGPLNSGKSFLLLYVCAYAYFHHNKKILFLTPESTIMDIQDRLTPIVGRFMNYSFSNKALRRGTEKMDKLQRYAEELMEFGRKDWITRDAGDMGSFGVMDIVQQAREHRPDIIAIDGVHLLGGEGDSWKKIQDSSIILKGLAQSMELVIIGGTQVQRDAVVADEDVSGLGQSAYGMAYVEACNKVIAIAEKRGDPMQRVAKLIKNRDGAKILTRQYLRFNVDCGDIGALNLDVDDSSGLVDFE